MPGSPPVARRRAPPSRPSSPTRRSRSRSWCRRPSKPYPLHGQRAGERRPFLLAQDRAPSHLLIQPAEDRAMAQSAKPRVVGFNCVALEVGDIEEALAFWGRLFEFELRGKSDDMAFIDLGDQFLALQKGRKQPPDDGRHFGLVVDDKEAVREALRAAGITVLPGRFLDFLDPWGNRIEIVGYDNIQFSKAPNVLR